MEAMGDDSEGDIKDGSNGAGTSRNVQGDVSVGVTLWRIELGGDRRYAQGTEIVPPLGGATDNGDAGKMWGRRRVGVSIGRGDDGHRGDPPHQSIHK